MSVLTLTHRPKRFAEVVGQAHVKTVLQAMVRSGSMPPAIILGGSRGTGKTTCARILAAALNCESQENGDCCGVCPSCKGVQQTNSLSVLEVDAASNGGVDEVRKIRDMCQYAHAGDWRVVLLDEAHSLSKEAFNALLKTLEEPPPYTVFVLVTTEVDKILETVRSRAMLFDFRRITQADIASRLRDIATEEHIEATDALLEELAARAHGGLRDGVLALDQARRGGISDRPEYMELFGIRDVSVPLFEAALAGDQPAGTATIGEQYRRTGDVTEMVGQLTALVRDLLVVRAGGDPECAEAARAEREDLARRVDDRQLVRVIQVLWDLRGRTRSTDVDQRSSMEMAFVLITEALRMRETRGTISEGREVARTATGQPRLGIREVRRLLGAQTAVAM